ncbi:MAG: hypothetical protein OHK93_004346 [Ramalina farinacea]|uniref:Uncharacterized protein n=1 Tax=Ramalina farinacea TaxID=258253 RepID=A0AA43QKU4_9LECA|nr:hypothetical protein [Ramalina farinacea]
MNRRRQSTLEVSSATSDSADSAQAMRQGKIRSSEESFAVFNKSFDSVEDNGDLPASRAYPKVLDIALPTGKPVNKDADTGALGRNDKNSHRPWPKQDKHQNGFKRKRDTTKPDPPGLPAHQQDDRLQRWLREPPAQGPYHGISDAGKDPYQARSTKGSNTKQHEASSTGKKL